MKSIYLIAPLTFIGASIFMGCTNANKVKQQIAADLYQITESQDCPAICDALKEYVKTKLGQ